MRSTSAPTLLPPPGRTDTRLVEPDEQWKADLRRGIERNLRHMVEDAQTVRDTILNSRSSESSRERAQREYEESMNDIQTLAQEEFNRELHIERSERKWALDMVDSNSPDVAHQQEWSRDNVHTFYDKRLPFISPNAPLNAEGAVLSTTPQQQGESDSERGSDEISEGGYGSARLEDEEGESGQSGETGEGGEDEEEEGDEGINPQQSPPDVSLTQPFHSRSPVARRNAPLLQQQPSNFQPVEDHDDGGAGASPVHAYLTRRRESQSYSHGGPPRRQSYNSQPPVWLPAPRSPEPSGISGHANGQMYSTSHVQAPSWGSTNSTGSNNRSAGRHRAGSLNYDQYRSGGAALNSDTGRRRSGSLNSDQHHSSSGLAHHNGPGRRRGGSLNCDQPRSSVALNNGPGRRRGGSLNCDQPRSSSIAFHSGTEYPSLQARDRMASDIPARERQNSASASQHERPSSSYLTLPLRQISNVRAPPLDDVERFSRSASASPHASHKPSLLSHPIRLPRAIPGASTPPFDEAARSPAPASPGSLANSGMQRSPEDMRQDIAIPRRRTSTDEGSRGTSRSSHHSRREFGDLHVHQEHNSNGDLPLITVDGDLSDVSDDVVGRLHGRRSVRSTRSMQSIRSMEREQMTMYWEAEARRKEGEATRKEEEAAKKEDEARRHEEKARLSLEEAERLQVHARITDASVKIREATVQKRDAEVDLKELEIKRREADVHRRELEVLLKEAEARRKEEEVTHREEDVREMEEEARHMENRAQQALETARRFESGVREAESTAKIREAAAQKREAEAKRKKAKVKKHEAEVKNIEEQLREKERYLHIREAEIQKMLRAVNERRGTMDLQDDSLEQNLAALGEWVEDACLTQEMAIERQGNDAEREDDLVSLASTTRNTSKHDNMMGLSSKDIAMLKDPGDYTNE